jgi:hypothetical protein
MKGATQDTLFAEIGGSEETSSTFALRRDKTEILIDDPTQSDKQREIALTVPEQEATRPALNVGFFSGPGVLIRDIIAGWRFYNINPQRVRMPSRETHDVDLGPAGENLAVVLHKLEQEGNSGLDTIVAGLRSVIPGFRDIKTVKRPVEGTWAVLWRQQHGSGAFNKIDFATRIAPRFDPEAVCQCSASFARCWARISSRARP